MKKILIILTVLGFLALGRGQAQAQCLSYGCYGNSYLYGLAAYTYFDNNASTSLKVAAGIDQGFSALFSSLALIEQGKALDAHIHERRTRLENAKMIRNLYTEGIPPFATVTPTGQERSPKITWDDVESIGHD